MNIKVNGNWQQFDAEKLSVTELLLKLKYSEPTIIVKFKDNIIKKPNFDQTILTDNDEILLIHICGGG